MTNPKTYKNSIRALVHQYFDANPEEELTALDIATKFGCSVTQAQRVALQCRHIDRVRAELRRRPSGRGRANYVLMGAEA